jgi:tetratricopeptide (TPR) repeat protein
VFSKNFLHGFFINVLERTESISLYANRHENLLKVNYDLYHERLFPEVTIEIFPQALSSFYHSLCAEYYRIAEIIEDQEKESFKALELYENNSLAIAEVAYFKVESDPLEAENLFRKAIKLTETQFAGSPKDRLFIKALGYSGLGYLYNKRAIYDIAEKDYNEALEILQSSNFQNPFVVRNNLSRCESGLLQPNLEIFDKGAILMTAQHNTALSVTVNYRAAGYDK